jgi:hypothetical protein
MVLVPVGCWSRWRLAAWGLDGGWRLAVGLFVSGRMRIESKDTPLN